ncbi:MAG: 16S rRNA (adenine(1518)-N(6)/adenine(1519)-N(6))-dimethyltransferase RsmA [Peptococcaceae bacterium]|nr:16S rRNA (adenine(1518)-N(6)/adenine(1519)-N(6))-dimethyltransferase RsmA [Peptococcaceae bacterium]
MSYLTSISKVKSLIEKYDLRPRKSLGQNFLLSHGVLEQIVAAAALEPDDVVLEIGPGLGVLTRELAAAGAKVIALELDRGFLTVLQESLADCDNVELVHGDALKIDLRALMAQKSNNGRFKLVSNLPYYITTPLVTRVLEEEMPLERMVIMVQKEVAARFTALPGTKEYGSLSVLVQYYTRPSIVCRVSRRAFYPPPEVDSAVVKLVKRDVPAVRVANRSLFFKIVRAAFAQRRKVLPKALAGAGLAASKDEWAKILQSAGIDPRRRGETLSLEEFARVAASVEKVRGTLLV